MPPSIPIKTRCFSQYSLLGVQRLMYRLDVGVASVVRGIQCVTTSAEGRSSRPCPSRWRYWYNSLRTFVRKKPSIPGLPMTTPLPDAQRSSSSPSGYEYSLLSFMRLTLLCTGKLIGWASTPACITETLAIPRLWSMFCSSASCQGRSQNESDSSEKAPLSGVSMADSFSVQSLSDLGLLSSTCFGVRTIFGNNSTL